MTKQWISGKEYESQVKETQFKLDSKEFESKLNEPCCIYFLFPIILQSNFYLSERAVPAIEKT